MRPVMLGIVGDSAAGKTTFTDGVVRLLGPQRVAVMCTDDYHRFDREQRRSMDITPLHPDCNYMDVMRQHLVLLASGEPILKPVYDHTTGTFAAPEYVVPRQFTIVEGLLAFSSKRMRDCFAVKVYLAPPEELRWKWKVERDCAKRGYTPDQVLAELARREPDSAGFIRTQRAFADVVVRFSPPNGVLDSAHLDLRLALRPTISHRDLTEIVEKASANGHAGSLTHFLGRDEGSPVDIVETSASMSPEATAELEKLVWERMDFDHHLHREDLGTFVEGNRERHSDALAVAQMLVAYHLLSAAAAGVD